MKKVLFLEDHKFFANEIIEFLKDDMGFEVKYASSFKECEAILKKSKGFDYAILDLILQNGHSGLEIADKYNKQFGRVIFLTGCVDRASLEAIKKYPSITKLQVVWDKLREFFDNPDFNEHV